MNKQEKINQLYNAFQNCKLCPLSKNRTNIVFGEGNLDSSILLVGEAPGRNEDLTGKPFVGKSGIFLKTCLKEAGLDEGLLYITNVVKCRPAKNRVPTKNESETCVGNILLAQIDIIQPKIIVSIGSHATKTILKEFHKQYKMTNFKISEEVEKTIELNNFLLMPIYHPAYIIRNPEKRYNFIKNLKKIAVTSYKT